MSFEQKEVAAREYRRLAEQGGRAAQHNFATLLYHGEGVARNYCEVTLSLTLTLTLPGLLRALFPRRRRRGRLH
jgi:hypothetical protein